MKDRSPSKPAPPHQTRFHFGPVPGFQPAKDEAKVPVIPILYSHCHGDAGARPIRSDSQANSMSVTGYRNPYGGVGMVERGQKLLYRPLRKVRAEPPDSTGDLAIHAKHRVALADESGQIGPKGPERRPNLRDTWNLLIGLHHWKAIAAIIEDDVR